MLYICHSALHSLLSLGLQRAASSPWIPRARGGEIDREKEKSEPYISSALACSNDAKVYIRRRRRRRRHRRRLRALLLCDGSQPAASVAKDEFVSLSLFLSRFGLARHVRLSPRPLGSIYVYVMYIRRVYRGSPPIGAAVRLGFVSGGGAGVPLTRPRARSRSHTHTHGLYSISLSRIYPVTPYYYPERSFFLLRRVSVYKR